MGNSLNVQGQGQAIAISQSMNSLSHVCAFKLISPMVGVKIPTHASVDIPLQYTPTAMVRQTASLIVQRGDGLRWTFPLIGIPDAPVCSTPITINGKARKPWSGEVKMTLAKTRLGVQNMNDVFSLLTLEMVIPEERKHQLVSRSFTLKPLRVEESGDGLVLIALAALTSLRAFSTAFYVYVCVKDGGRWPFKIQLESEDADIDDVLVIEGNPGQPSGITFRLPPPPHFKEKTPFKAFFGHHSNSFGAPSTAGGGASTAGKDANAMFKVTPTQGVMEPFVEGVNNNTTFQIVFHPTKRLSEGQIVSTILHIDSEDMQWNFEVKGIGSKIVRN
jgi:hypothetical protein